MLVIYSLILMSGFAALSWEVIWQLKAASALGVSAWGTAITLAVMMGGMSLGGFIMGKALHNATPARAIRLYGTLELVIGVAGLLLNTAFLSLEQLDTWAYALTPSSISLVYMLGITAILGVPAVCMGATLPTFAIFAKQFRTSIAKLYSLNTLGAAVGALAVAVILIPLFGITHSTWIIAAVNILAGIFALVLARDSQTSVSTETNLQTSNLESPSAKIISIIFISGFATFTLEVAWFRSLQNLLPNTTDIFAIMLACTLLALGLAAKKVPQLKQQQKNLGAQMCMAGLFILLVTPLIEHLDYLSMYTKQFATHSPANITAQNSAPTNDANAYVHYIFAFFVTFSMIYFILVPPMRYLGIAFPWIMDDQRSSRSVGKLYAVNTLAAIVGSVGSAWILLPTIGFVKTAWLAGVLVLFAGLSLLSGLLKRCIWAASGLLALSAAIALQTGVGKTHVLGFFASDENGKPGKILNFFEGPDATTSAVAYADGSHALLINSTLASLDAGNKHVHSSHYMAWMGHLPMLLQTNPQQALVICFGTGQTANAVRKENPQELDIVDINVNVFKLAHYFNSNQDVLKDPRVKTIVMDGRAYMRRTAKKYDIITLEPMPPGTVGVNALYSKEFYESARQKLQPDGVIAQWLPFNGIAPEYAASIAKTFQQVFPNAVLWLDSASYTGILLGVNNTQTIATSNWPGFQRVRIERNLSQQQIEQSIALNAEELKMYSAHGRIISDDNQLLSYGKVLYATGLIEANFQLLHEINNKISVPTITHPFI